MMILANKEEFYVTVNMTEGEFSSVLAGLEVLRVRLATDLQKALDREPPFILADTREDDLDFLIHELAKIQDMIMIIKAEMSW